VPAGLGRLADLLHARSIIKALLGRLAATPDAAAAEESLCATKHSVSRRSPVRPGLWERLDSQARATAIEVLARLIAQIVLAAMPREERRDD
jgi:hypothetical protein